MPPKARGKAGLTSAATARSVSASNASATAEAVGASAWVGSVLDVRAVLAAALFLQYPPPGARGPGPRGPTGRATTAP